MRLWVPSLALLSGLRIWHCYGCGVGQQLQFQFDPSLGTPYATGMSQKEAEEKKKGCLLNIQAWTSDVLISRHFHYVTLTLVHFAKGWGPAPRK